MARRYDTNDVTDRATGLREAASAVRRGELVVLPTDTVYGIGADAFSSEAVHDLLEAKGRGRNRVVPHRHLAGQTNSLETTRARRTPWPRAVRAASGRPAG